MNNHERFAVQRAMMRTKTVNADSAPRVPLALDTTNFERSQVEAMKRMRQLDPNTLEAKSMLGVDRSPSIGSMLD